MSSRADESRSIGVVVRPLALSSWRGSGGPLDNKFSHWPNRGPVPDPPFNNGADYLNTGCSSVSMTCLAAW